MYLELSAINQSIVILRLRSEDLFIQLVSFVRAPLENKQLNIVLFDF